MTRRHSPERNPAPPRLARLLARLASLRVDRDLLLADLAERFSAIAQESGLGRARLWYWGQALRSLPAGVWSLVDAMVVGSGGGLVADVQRSGRGLRRRPLYAFGVIGTMAMGLASVATVMSIAWNVWLSPLPIPAPERVVRVFELEPAEGSSERARRRVSPPLLEDMRAREWSTLNAVAGLARNLHDYDRDGSVSRVRALSTSPEALGILGIIPDIGRVVTADPDAREVVLTEPFWRRAFGGDPTVVGSATMILNGEPHLVVGVVRLPDGYPGDADVLTLLRWSEDQLTEGMRGARYVDVIARVEPGRSVSDAARDIDGWVSGLGATHPNHEGWGGDASVLADELLAPYRGVLGMLTVAGGLFLALALSNVVGLVAARSVEGRWDRQVRLAIGASESQLLRSSTIDGGLVGALAAVSALGATLAIMGPVRALVPAEIPRAELIGLNAGLAATLAGVAIVAGFGVGALGHLLSRSVSSDVPRGTVSGLAGTRARSTIVAGQVALTMLLATGGAVVLDRLVELRQTDLGFEARGVAVTPVNLVGVRYPTPEARLAFWDALVDQSERRGLDLTFGTSSPMAGVNMQWGYRLTPGAEQFFAQYHIVDGRYFEVLGIELLDGRVFTPADRDDSEQVVIVNRSFADRHFPGEGVIGREIEVTSTMRRIVGIVESTRHFGPGDEIPDEIYAPYGQDPWPHAQLLLAGDPGAMSVSVAALLDGIDPQLGVPPLKHYGEYVADWFAAIRLQAVIVGVLALVGTLLATLGLYALVAYRVTARRREIGIRMALGATERRVFGHVVVQGAVLALAGISIGSLVWVAAAPTVGQMIDGQTGLSWLPLMVAALVGVVCIAACAIPAARSVSVDPARTLRAEDR